MPDPAHRGSPTEEHVQTAVDEVLDGAEAARRAPPPARVEDTAEEERVPSWAETLVRLLDDGIRVPGTELRFGLDGILGLIFPAAGDMVTGAGALSLLFLAIKERVPTVVIGRMVMNIAIDAIVGSVPILGDAFDFFFKANRKNLELIERHRDDPDARPSAGDYLLVGAGVLLVGVSILVPLLIVLLLGTGLWALLEG